MFVFPETFVKYGIQMESPNLSRITHTIYTTLSWKLHKQLQAKQVKQIQSHKWKQEMFASSKILLFWGMEPMFLEHEIF